MDIKIIEKLNPICEILGLLYMSNDYGNFEKMAIEQLSNEGINGEIFIKKNLRVIEKYVKAFDKYKVINDNEILFLGDNELEIFLILASVLINNNNIIENISGMTNEELKKLIIDVYNNQAEGNESVESIGDLRGIIDFLKEADISESSKWKMIAVLDAPKNYYIRLIGVINDNMKAYEEAYKAIGNHINKLLSDLIKYINSGKCEILNNIIEIPDQENVIIPTLAFGATFININNTYFVGLLVELVYKEKLKVMGNKGELVLKLKALSDKSKLEIITLLKSGHKYNLEIAEALGLSPATVSYHMGSLLEYGMVTIEKKQGKVYYFLNEPGLKNFMNELSNVLF